jgi:hypothetical protein|tara:strand:- start:13614 stop:14453 length:840 start_codon:yes stop_codon:yes gene_type:complete
MMVTVLERIRPREVGQDKEIGIEIEMEGRNLVVNSAGWAVDHDGSLRGESIEYILRSPCRRESVSIKLKRLQKDLKDQGAKLVPSSRCGVHIHVNCQRLSLEELLNFALLYYIFEDILMEYCGRDRTGNLFCLPLSAADYILDALMQFRAYEELNALNSDDIRYAALNWNSLFNYGSLEFRAYPAVKDFTKIEKWISLLLRIFDYAKKYKQPDEILEEFSMEGPRQFLMQVFKEDTQLLPLRLQQLEEMLYDGARRIQDICYTVVEERPRKKKKKMNQK